MTILTEQLSPTLDRLSLEVELLKQTGALAAQARRLFVNQWLIAWVLRRDTRGLRAQIAALLQKAESVEVDPDDRFADLLLTLQQSISRMIRLRDEQLRSRLSLGARWMLRWSKSLLVVSHAELGELRVAIMEHDADVSPVMNEVFTSAEDLIAALHRDVAT